MRCKSNNNSSSMDAEILEQGDIYFFYRFKKAAEEVKVSRMYGGFYGNSRFYELSLQHEEGYRSQCGI
ncbi:MAG: hypothetical protein JO297_10605 [Nitrososphaeraceae archaeon]|nr:hypothetical protein [Nitrososphaeraceae archaeon]